MQASRVEGRSRVGWIGYNRIGQHTRSDHFTKASTNNTVANTTVASVNVQNGAKEQKAKKREKDMIQQTMILFSVVVLFGLFHILRIILNIEEFASLEKRKRVKEQNDGCEWLQYWAIIASPISHLLLQLNSSLNFIIYCYFNKSFRDVLILWVNVALTSMKLKRAQRNDRNSNEESFRMIRAKPPTMTTAVMTEIKDREDSKEEADLNA